MANVSLKSVEKKYDNGFKAVHGIDLEIHDGEFMVFVGPSGCAKSTTLRMIAGPGELPVCQYGLEATIHSEWRPFERRTGR